MKSKYKIAVQEDEQWKQVEVEGEEIKIPGFEEFTFILHEPHDTSAYDLIITEVSCGGIVAKGFSRKGVVEMATDNLKNVGILKFKAMIEVAKQTTGLTP